MVAPKIAYNLDVVNISTVKTFSAADTATTAHYTLNNKGMTENAQLPIKKVYTKLLEIASLFTPPTRTRQNCLVVSCLVCVDGVNRTADKTRQFCLVLTQFPISKFSAILNIFETEQLQTGNCIETRDKTALSCRQLCSHRRHRQGKTRRFCLVCGGGVNKL